MASKLLVPAIALAVLSAALAQPAMAARIKCWTNRDGVRECGNAVPPEYAQKGHEEVSRGGLTLERQEAARSAAEVEAERLREEAAQASAADERRRYDRQAASDRVLLDTYAREEDLALAHQQKLDAIDQRVAHSRDHIAKLEESLGAMQHQAANLERAGKAVPDALLADIKDIQRQIDETERFIHERRAEKAEIERQHAADLARFRFLKDGGAIGTEVAS